MVKSDLVDPQRFPVSQKENNEKHSVIDKMIEDNCTNFQKLRRFDQAQYHQCMPNPIKEGEMITVQLLKPRLTQANPSDTLKEMQTKINNGKFHNKAKMEDLYCSYIVKLGQYTQSRMRSRYDLQILKAIGKTEYADTMAIKKELEMIKSKKKLHSAAVSKTMQVGQEMAIIGFWKMEKESSQFSCYRYFFVPNPVMREIKRSDRDMRDKHSTVSAQQVLFKGVEDEIFLFLRDEDEMNKQVGILNLNDQEIEESNLTDNHPQSHLNEQNLRVFKITNHQARNAIDNNVLDIQWIRQHAQLIRGFDEDESQRNKNHVLVIPTFNYKDGHQEFKLIFYNIEKKETVKIIRHGEVFLAHERRGGRTIVKYMSHHQVMNSTVDEQTHLQQHDLIVEHVMKDKELFCRATDDNSTSIKLDFTEIDEKYSSNTQSKVLEAYLHNSNTRLTYVRQGMRAYTFELPTQQQVQMSHGETPQKGWNQRTSESDDFVDEPDTRFIELGSPLVKKESVKQQQQVESKPKLLYYFESNDVRAETRKNGNKTDVYILSNIKDFQSEEKSEEPRTFDFKKQSSVTTFYYNLYNVSTVEKDACCDHQFTPVVSHEIKFMINQTFSNAHRSLGKYLYQPMPLHLLPVKNGMIHSMGTEFQVIGSMLYEEEGTGKLVLSFYRADTLTFKSFQPQQPLKQSYFVKYPFIAYKCMEPDNKTIAIVSLAHNIPQQVISLGYWEFVSFVGGTFGKRSLTMQIMFLVKDVKIGQQKLMMIETEPWKRIDKNQPYELIFKIKEFKGVLSQSLRDEDPLIYSSDKIRSIQFIQSHTSNAENKNKITLGALVIQFNHCIATAVLERSFYSSCKKKENNFKIHCALPEMVQEYLVRGVGQSIYFGKFNAVGGSSIIKLDFNPKANINIDTKEVYVLNSRLVALETKNYQDLLTQTDQSPKQAKQQSERIFALCGNQILYVLKMKANSEMFECEAICHYTLHNLDSIIDDNWSKSHISPKQLTYNDTIYRVHPENPHSVKPAKAYYWADKKSIESYSRETEFEFLNVESIFKNSGMLAIGTEEDRGGSCFILQPSPGLRKYHLINGDHVPLVSHKCFVTNNHVLIQLFNKAENRYQTVVMQSNGTVVMQSKKVSQYLNTTIVGQSDLVDGKLYLITRAQIKRKVQQSTCEKTPPKKTKKLAKSATEQALQFQISAPISVEGLKPISSVTISNSVFFSPSIVGKNKIEEPPDGLICFQFSRNGKAKIVKSIPEFVKKLKNQFTESMNIGELTKETREKLERNVTKIKDGDDLAGNQLDKRQFSEHITTCKHQAKLPSLGHRQSTIIKGRTMGIQHTFTHARTNIIRVKDNKLQALQQVLDLDTEERRESVATSQMFASKVLVTDCGKLVQISGVILPESECLESIAKDENSTLKHENQKPTVDVVPSNDGVIQVIFYQEVGEVTYTELENMQYALVGPYLCFCRCQENKVWIINVLQEEKDPSLCMRHIDLKLLMNESEDSQKYLKFNRVSETSFQTVDYGNSDEIQYFENLIQITVRNETYIFNIKKDSIGEINFITKMDQMLDPEMFVNTGIRQQSVLVVKKHDDKNMNKAKIAVLLSNQQVSLYFWMTNTSKMYYNNKGKSKWKPVKTQKKCQYSAIQEKFQDRQYSGMIYRTQTYIDLLDLQYIQEAVKDEEDFYIEQNTILSTYYGHTIFSIFIESFKVYQQVLDQFRAEFDTDFLKQNKKEAPLFRSLYRILIMPTTDLDKEKTKSDYNCMNCMSEEDDDNCQCTGFFPITMKSVWFEKEDYRDNLIQISSMCRETEITNFINSLDDLNELFVKINPHLNQLLEHAYTQTRHCERIDTLEWDHMDSIVIVPSGETFIDADGLAKLMRKERSQRQKFSENFHKSFVDVRMLRINWLFKGSEGKEQDDLLNLMETIEKNPSSNEAPHTNEFFEAIIEAKWSIYEKSILNYFFYPFLVYAFLSILFIPYLLPEFDESKAKLPWLEMPFKISLYILTVYNGSFEVIQFLDKGWNYLLQPNIVYLYSALLNMMLLLTHDFLPQVWDWDIVSKRVQVTIAVGLTWVKIIYWLRLFQSTAFFIDLISKTFRDINFLAFIFVSGILVTTVANMLWILNMGRDGDIDHDGHPSNRIFPSSVNSDFMNAMIYTYMTSQGEYQTDDFHGEHSWLIWIIFLLITFVIQITFLNMLIAIMGNTFQQVLENKQQSAMKERINLISDFRLVLERINPNSAFTYPYIFEVRPAVSSNDVVLLTAVKQTVESQASKILSKQAQWTQNQNEMFANLRTEISEIHREQSEQSKLIQESNKRQEEMIRNIQLCLATDETIASEEVLSGIDQVGPKIDARRQTIVPKSNEESFTQTNLH